ncbi:MAG: hypothetical protein IKL95_01200 [Alphaproteobacteria bacterium]|nr:hypothetical protein [Alphaproteobacteria bacterium]
MKKILSAALALVCVWFATPARAALPSGYTQLEYIESERGAYIDTGISYGKFVHDIQFTIDGQRNLLGCGVSDSMFWEATDADRFIFSSSSNGYILGNPANRNIVEFSINTTEASLTVGNDTRTHTHSSTSNRTYLLFALNGSTTYSALAKLYSLKVYNDSDVLIQDLVPAKRNSDGAVGLYDTVSGEFFENSGSGEFIAGPVVEIKIATTKYNETKFSPLNTALQNAISVVDSVVSNTITQAGRIATLQAQKQTRPNDIADDNEKCPAGKKCLLVEDASGTPHWYEIVEQYSRLPEGFTELQYVSNAANTYLDTGIIPTVDNVVMEMKVKPSTNSWYIWQNRDPSNSVIHGFSGANTGSKISFAFPNDSVATSTITRTGNILTMRSTMLNGQGKLYVHDDATNESDEQTIAYTFSAETLPYYLFGNQRSDTVNSGNVVYYAKMYMNDELVMDYIPAKRNRDGAIGFYDLASQSFKQANHGSFIAGPVAQ